MGEDGMIWCTFSSFFSSRRRHTRCSRDWSSDVCSSDLLTALFGGLALLLATIGLYGVTAYTVARRTSEIGIRMALGAPRGGVIAMVMRGAMSQTAIGLAIGILATLPCARLVESQLYELKGVNATALAASVLTLAASSTPAGALSPRGGGSPGSARDPRAWEVDFFFFLAAAGRPPNFNRNGPRRNPSTG